MGVRKFLLLFTVVACAHAGALDRTPIEAVTPQEIKCGFSRMDAGNMWIAKKP